MAQPEISDRPSGNITIDYKKELGKYFPLPLQYIGYFLLFLALYSLLAFSFLTALLLLIIGIFFGFSHYGILVNFHSKIYKEYWGPPGFLFGSWKPMLNLDYISVFKTITSQEIFSQVHGFDLEGIEYQVNLIMANRQCVTVFAGKDKAEAFKLAKFFAANLDLKIYDASEPGNHKWLEMP